MRDLIGLLHIIVEEKPGVYGRKPRRHPTRLGVLLAIKYLKFDMFSTFTGEVHRVRILAPICQYGAFFEPDWSRIC